MADDNLSIEDAAARIASLGTAQPDLQQQRPGNGADPEPPAPEPEPEPQPDDLPALEPEPALEGDDVTAALPLEAPASWSDADKVKFSNLPPDVQEVIAQRERERDVDLRRQQNEFATERQTFDKLRGEIDAERQRYLDKIDPILSFWSEQQTADEARLAALINSGDTEEAMRLQLQMQARERQLSDARAQKEEIERQQRQDQERALNDLRAQERNKLMQAFPQWSDPKKQQADLRRMNEYGRFRGFSEEELGAVMDSRYFQVLHDAATLHALRQGKPQANKRQAQPSRPIKPGVPMSRGEQRSEGDSRALANLRKNPRSIDAAAAVIRQRIQPKR